MKLGHRDAVALLGLTGAIWFASLARGAQDLWAVFVLCGWLSLTCILFLADGFGRTRPIYLPFLSSFSLMLLGFLLSSQSTFDMNTTRLELWIWFASGIALFLFSNLFREPSQRLQFLKFAGLIIIPVTLIALRQTPGSVSASLTNPAVLAGFAASWLILFWHFRRQDRVFSWLFVACVLALLLARSWWSLISASIGFALYYQKQISAAFLHRRSTALRYTAILVGLFTLSAFLKFGLSLDPFKSGQDRWNWWLAGARMFFHHPIMGVGLGSFGTAYPFFKSPAALNSLYAHSFLIQLLSETGLVGLTGVLIFAVACGRKLFWRQTLSQEDFAYRAAVLTVLIYSLGTIYLDYFIGKLMLMMCVALSISSIPFHGRALSKAFVGVLSLGILMLAPSWYLSLRASQYHAEGLRLENSGDRSGARACFEQGLRLNRYQDESNAQLAKLYRDDYAKSRSLSDLSEWRFYMDQAIRWKKDFRYLADMNHPPE